MISRRARRGGHCRCSRIRVRVRSVRRRHRRVRRRCRGIRVSGRTVRRRWRRRPVMWWRRRSDGRIRGMDRVDRVVVARWRSVCRVRGVLCRRRGVCIRIVVRRRSEDIPIAPTTTSRGAVSIAVAEAMAAGPRGDIVRGDLLFGHRLLDGDRHPVHHIAIAVGQHQVGRLRVVKPDKAKAPGSALRVRHHRGILHFAPFLKVQPQSVRREGVRQSAYEQLAAPRRPRGRGERPANWSKYKMSINPEIGYDAKLKNEQITGTLHRSYSEDTFSA